jgi:stage II sporulation protein AA (anti-sigma F factor antagonist)
MEALAMATQRYRWFRTEEVGDVTVVRFTHRGILAGEEVEGVAEQLHRLVDEEGRRRLLLNLENVESIASAVLGRFLVLHHKLLAAGGRLKFCNLCPPIREIFATAQLTQLFGIYHSEPDALRTF